MFPEPETTAENSCSAEYGLFRRDLESVLGDSQVPKCPHGLRCAL